MPLEKKDFLHSITVMLEPDGKIAYVAMEHGFIVTEDGKHLTRSPGVRQLLHANADAGLEAAVKAFRAALAPIALAAAKRDAAAQAEQEANQRRAAEAAQEEARLRLVAAQRKPS